MWQKWKLGAKRGGLHFEHTTQGRSRWSAQRPELKYLKHAARCYLAGKPALARDAQPHLLPCFDNPRVRRRLIRRYISRLIRRLICQFSCFTSMSIRRPDGTRGLLRCVHAAPPARRRQTNPQLANYSGAPYSFFPFRRVIRRLNSHRIRRVIRRLISRRCMHLCWWPEGVCQSEARVHVHVWRRHSDLFVSALVQTCASRTPDEVSNAGHRDDRGRLRASRASWSGAILRRS